jgi:hypothetical protein
MGGSPAQGGCESLDASYVRRASDRGKKKKRSRERHEFEIPNPDSNSTRRAHRSQRAELVIAANLDCGVRLQGDLGYPETYPKEVLAAGGRPRTSLEHRRTRSSLENRIFSELLDVYGHLRTSLDGAPGRIRSTS